MPGLKTRLHNLRTRPLRQTYYGLGARASLPFPMLKAGADLVDRVRIGSEFAERRDAASALLKGSAWEGRMPYDQGYALVRRDEIPGVDTVLENAKQIITERAPSRDTLDDRISFNKLFESKDVLDYPAILDLALTAPILHTVTDYCGSLPVLHDINIWMSPPVSKLRSSHFFHLDKPEVHYIGVFILLGDIGSEDGPLTLFPANRSQQISERSGYLRRYNLEPNARLSDDEIEKAADGVEPVQMTGVAGDMGIVDTSRCYHFGSRCRDKTRFVLQYRFAPAHKMEPQSPELFEGHPYGEDPIARLVLKGAVPAN